MPRHFAAKLDKYMYILPYSEFFVGVSGLTVEQFWKINGFPNAFWGWGGEDDDLWNRLVYKQGFYKVMRALHLVTQQCLCSRSVIGLLFSSVLFT
ncbi:hypothetical protein KUCAC02_014611 [Chaenocephalus aceratus]|uniref:Uncharacterized protein n=1 Tax=Chaenocephalus aceratus TaxID=36190 RepID=A0ACB9WED4_CHAAC|nr:hypothetical protein KUCAC02_014611 [Chaenocephalus aceratus]